MGNTKPFNDQSISFNKRVLPWLFCALLPIALVHLYFYNLPFVPSQKTELSHSSSITNTIVSNSSKPSLSVSASSPSPSPSHHSSAEKENANDDSCDYSNGKWVHDKRGPLYNDKTCDMIKEGRNCITHGRPDSGYLHWRWKPIQCNLPRFDPNSFLQLINNKHIAFVGDSLARNQLESLLCMLSTASTPNTVFQNNGIESKFGKWHFIKHNASISLYWSPFLVQGVEKSSKTGMNNKLYLDHVDENWAKDMDQMDLIVLSIGHWFLLPAIYYESGSVLGCHYCPGLNHTEIGFYDVLRKALKTTLNSIIERRGKNKENGIIDVIVTTFSPHHFEGDWDKAGACPKTRPYMNWEKKLEGMDAEMRKIEIEEVEYANNKSKSKEFGGFRLKALDVTKLALLRPDGHPGPYMNHFPFANGVSEYVQNDCVHWCLPGPIDTWNEILLDMLKKWDKQQKYKE